MKSGQLQTEAGESVLLVYSRCKRTETISTTLQCVCYVYDLCYKSEMTEELTVV